MKNKLYTLPNAVTLCNLACGCAAIVLAGSGGVAAAFRLIAAAAVFDFADGLVARLTGQCSPLGTQLDSLADMVSFGVAPSVILLAVYRTSPALWSAAPPALYDTLGWGVFAIALFSALRLAKFNVDESQREEFAGLPTPAAALAIAALGWMCGKGQIAPPREMILAVAALVSALLVCPLRMFSLKFKSLKWRGNELRYIFLASAACAIACFGIGGIAVSVGLYVAASAARVLAPSAAHRKK